MLISGFGKKTIDALSFTSEIREPCEILNRKLEQSDEGFSKTIASHPGGFSKELSRRILFYRIMDSLEKGNPEMTVFYMGVSIALPKSFQKRR
jgi:hypothetical protein